MQTEVVTKDLTVQDRSPAAMIQLAVSQGADLEKLEKLLELQLRWEANEAKKAFVIQMAKFKENPPEILKTVHVEYVNAKNQTVKWDHADLGELTEEVNKGLSKYGLYSRWEVEQPDAKTVRVTCIITNDMGHSERTTLQGPPDTSGGKDELKSVASTITVLQRLTLLSATGIAPKGIDKESVPDQQFITVDQQTEINDMVKDIYDPRPEIFWNYMKVESADQILAKDYNKAISALNKAKEHRGKK